MNNYKVTSRKWIGFKKGKCIFKVTIIVDTEQDIPEPQDEWYPGSMCQIAETHKYKVLNNEGEWK